jgi:hypothetical protein
MRKPENEPWDFTYDADRNQVHKGDWVTWTDSVLQGKSNFIFNNFDKGPFEVLDIVDDTPDQPPRMVIKNKKGEPQPMYFGHLKKIDKPGI